MLLRPIAPEEDVALLLAGAQSDCGAPLVAGRRRRIHADATGAVIAEVDGTPVGLASYRVGPRHPRLAEVGVDVLPEFRTPDVTIGLVDAVLDLTGDRIVETKAAVEDPVTEWVRSRPDFRHEITVRNGMILTSGRPEPPGPLPVGYAVETFDELTRPIEMLYEQIYAEGHTWTGETVSFPSTGSFLSVVGTPVSIGLVWNRTGSPVAASAVTLGSGLTGGAYLVPGGVVESERMQRSTILAHVVDATLHAAWRAGVKQVEYEDSRPDWALQGEVLDRFDRDQEHVTEMWIRRP